MNIFDIVTSNFLRKARSRKPGDIVPCPEGYRGELLHNASLCTVCGTCTYMCSPGAISQSCGEESASWCYDTGRCTFCGRCVEYCPTKALRFAEKQVQLFHERGAQQIAHEVLYQHCSRCGAVILPLPVESLERLYHSAEAAHEAEELHKLCEKCRGRVHSERLKSGLSR